jgi:hypothetical protein
MASWTQTIHRARPVLVGFALAVGVMVLARPVIRMVSGPSPAVRDVAATTSTDRSGAPNALAGSLLLTSTEGPSAAEPREFPRVIAPLAKAGYQGAASPGRRIVLSAEGSQGANLRYRWVQTQGPPVALETPDKPSTGLVVPQGASALGFSLVVSDPSGMDASALKVPVASGDGVSVSAAALKADAGDDQVAMVGHRVNLSGALSEPRGQVGYRWLQMSGPKVRLSFEEGSTFAFVPPLPGVYRFGLVVASGREISGADEVTVTVASPSASLGTTGLAPGDAEPTTDLARRLLTSVRGGADVAVDLAEVFDGTADRMDLYQSYAETFNEVSRRLEGVVPPDPAVRGTWSDRLFTPLTTRLIERMLPDGLDLRRPEGQNAELTLGQRARMAELFREVAEGFRAAKSSR